jgi:cell wall-associated NlpC family hydrolase
VPLIVNRPWVPPVTPAPVAIGQSKQQLVRPTLSGQPDYQQPVNNGTENQTQQSQTDQNSVGFAQFLKDNSQNYDSQQGFLDTRQVYQDNRKNVPAMRPIDRLTQDQQSALDPVSNFVQNLVRPDFSNFYDQLQETNNFGAVATETSQQQADFLKQKQQAMIAGIPIPAPGGITLTGKAQAEANNIGARAVALAKKSLGVPYVFGGNSLSKGIDCSGLVQQVYKAMGIRLPRTAAEQAKSGRIIASGGRLKGAQPGDLLIFDSQRSTGLVRNGHVAIYIGNGQMIEAPHTGARVRIRFIGSSFVKAVVRPY